ncbi:hypothetical protein ACQ4PT_031410 [Festuca glaucescens]
MDKLRRSSRAIYSLGETVSPPVLATAMMHLRGWFELFLSHVVGWFVLFPRYLSLFRRSQIGGELGQWSAAAAVAAAASVSGSPPVRRLSPPWSSPRVAAGRDPNSQTILRRLLSGSPSYASLLFPVTSELAGGQSDAQRLFGEMPPGEENGSAPPVRAGDRIGALPDDILHHLLSFLPVQSAVRTCVLARRWRHLWKFTTSLRIVGVQRQGPVQELRKFLDHLLILRERMALDTVEIEFSEFLKDDVPYVNLWTRFFAEKIWTRFGVQWGVRALTLHINHCARLYLDGLPLVSQHLNTLDLDGVGLQLKSLDFSCCPALKDLKMNFCEIHVHKISCERPPAAEFVFSRDLKQCPTFSKLKSLLLNEYWCMAPDLDPLACSLKNSPVLEKLSLQLFSNGGDIIEMIGSYSSVERSSAISEHLKIVEVKFHEMDKTTRKVLKFLCTFNIRFRIE